MNFDEYQTKARSTAIYKESIIYPALGLGGESGEVLEKIKKLLRDNDGVATFEFRDAIEKELGDVLWYVANLAHDCGLSLDSIARQNIEKLQSRKTRGKIQGSGDDR